MDPNDPNNTLDSLDRVLRSSHRKLKPARKITRWRKVRFANPLIKDIFVYKTGDNTKTPNAFVGAVYRKKRSAASMAEADISTDTSSGLSLPSEYRKKLRSSSARQHPTINSASLLLPSEYQRKLRSSTTRHQSTANTAVYTMHTATNNKENTLPTKSLTGKRKRDHNGQAKDEGEETKPRRFIRAKRKLPTRHRLPGQLEVGDKHNRRVSRRTRALVCPAATTSSTRTSGRR
ncbi:hypothetical protein [Parasitella parasitica]|uniref:Uncharacterized protein n=1 Tax=Parasitella parasitica TaxID=35722 RepID=A0A0B7NBH6_9FUNG|nr:hypothetical protein [Parasitella parasitica]